MVSFMSILRLHNVENYGVRNMRDAQECVRERETEL